MDNYFVIAKCKCGATVMGASIDSVDNEFIREAFDNGLEMSKVEGRAVLSACRCPVVPSPVPGWARVKVGAKVWQDRRCIVMSDDETIFSVEGSGPSSFTLRAHGYGLLNGEEGSYGNGAIHVNWSDLVWLDENGKLV